MSFPPIGLANAPEIEISKKLDEVSRNMGYFETQKTENLKNLGSDRLTLRTSSFSPTFA